MDGLFATIELEPDGSSRAGFRLDRLEVYNWGTFDGRVSTLLLHGDNALLTGDIGSGKSTLVDAVTTLLVPSNKISYNKAAGADTRERDLRSYVLGHYKSERIESTGASRPIGLRDQRTYSVLLGVFRNEGFDEEVTLAQVFWVKDTSAGQPQRYFVTAPRALTIVRDFSSFGTDINVLKRRLRAGGASVEDHFPAYGQQARRLLGIHSEQAMELFHQTVSLKSVGNLDDFVRRHMLEPADPNSKIASLVAHFQHLTAAHDAVRRARDQLAQLEPLLVHCDTHDRLALQIAEAQGLSEALRFYFADVKKTVLTDALQRIRVDLEVVDEQVITADNLCTRLRAEQEQLRIERHGAGGDRIGELERLISTEEQTRGKREATRERHADLLSHAGLDPVTDAVSFRRRLAQLNDGLARERAVIVDEDNRIGELKVERHGVDEQSNTVNAELVSLRDRRSNIPLRSIQIRHALCEALGLTDEELPFAGELIQVLPDHQEWQGAAERVLHSFALSILVPNAHYQAVSRWINDHHLGTRVVYYRVTERQLRETQESSDHPQLVDLLEVKDGPFAAWLDNELIRRASHACAPDLEVFQRERRAVTMNGLVKSPDGRHEKDDRSRIDDRSHYVLGWSNEQKIDALLEQAKTLHDQLATLASELADCDRRKLQADARRSVLEQLSSYQDWSDLDWQASVKAISAWRLEKQQLEAADSRIVEITSRLAVVDDELSHAEQARNDAVDRRGGLRNQRINLESALSQQQTVLDGAADIDAMPTRYDAITALLDDGVPSELSACDRAQDQLARQLRARIDDHHTAKDKAAGGAVRAMSQFRSDYPDVTAEMDASIDAANEFRSLRDQLANDDLPRFEKDFKDQLNTNTINDLAGFYAWLRREADQIRVRIETINSSLHGIDYNEGRFIKLEARRTTHQDIKDFQSELRACTDDSVLDQSEQYSEERFLRVKAIIERFQGRETQSDADRRWTRWVTDVRNWFTFAASERYRETDEEWEHYTDSDGKSGGQKEKLAYTVLAASLAYQFKLEWGVAKSRDFRFAVIDEAFGRGSDVSTRYALGLFRRLGLQLLIVTPLQKVHIIEPFVSAVGFVENRSGECSLLQSLTIEEYVAQRTLSRLPVTGTPS